MNKLVAGYIKMGPKERAEEQFNQIQKKNKQALLAKEKAKLGERGKTARLKSLRLAKEPNPIEHAEVLLEETSLTAHQIAEATGLDVYQVFGMKLKSRSFADALVVP